MYVHVYIYICVYVCIHLPVCTFSCTITRMPHVYTNVITSQSQQPDFLSSVLSCDLLSSPVFSSWAQGLRVLAVVVFGLRFHKQP